MKLRFLKLMLLLFILPLQMLAAELGVAGKQLAALPGVSNVETLKSTHFPEKYVFFIKQQLDAKDASKGYFEQRVVLCHRGFDRPTVLVTEGYNANYALREGYIEELSKLFDTNIITVEYRYFDKSMPKPCNWDYLTVENSLYDLHHVNQTLHAMYKGKWIATGISKGGQTTMFYRSYFPDDVDISVPYVAPLNKGVEDGRHEKFLQYQVSTKENRQKVLDFQLLLFKRKAALLPMFEKYCNDKKYVFNAPLAEILITLYSNTPLLSGSGEKTSTRFLQERQMTRRCLITGSTCVNLTISPTIMPQPHLMCRQPGSWVITAIIPNHSRNISVSRLLRAI